MISQWGTKATDDNPRVSIFGSPLTNFWRRRFFFVFFVELRCLVEIA